MLLTTQPQDLVLDLEWRPVQVMMRGAGTIRDPGFATLSVSVQQPVSTLTKDPHRWATSPSLDNDTVNQQQPTTNSQIRPQSGTRGPPVDRRERFQRPTQRSSLHQRPVSPTSRPSTPGGGSSAVLACGWTPGRTPSPSSSRPNGPESSSPPGRASRPTTVTARCCDCPCGTTEPN